MDMFRRGFPVALIFLALLCGITGCGKAADRLEGAAWRVTASGVEAAGIRVSPSPAQLGKTLVEAIRG